jgi:hypothetical protein
MQSGAKPHWLSLVHMHHGEKQISNSWLNFYHANYINFVLCNGECTRVISILAPPLHAIAYKLSYLTQLSQFKFMHSPFELIELHYATVLNTELKILTWQWG